MMKMCVSSAALLLLLAAATGSAQAQSGNVYVPLASNILLQGANYSTKLWVANPDGTQHHFTTTFIQQGADGTASAAPTSATNFVPATDSEVLANLAPAGQTGLLSINGVTALVVGARLEITNSDGALLGLTSIPVITQSDLAAPGDFMEVMGLQRGIGNVVSDYSMVNFGSVAAQCTVAAIQSTGAVLAAPTTFSVPALSRRDFSDVLAILGATSISDVRVAATCNQPFYTFATVYAPGTGAFTYVAPSPTLAGTVGPPVGSPSGGGPPSNGDVSLVVPGTFLNATTADSEQAYNLATPVGVAYKRATIQWDMHVGIFPVGLFTGVMAFRRPNNSRTLREPFCAVQIVNRNSKTLLDLGVENIFARTVGPWKQNSDYHCQLTYDLTINQCELQVSQGSGPVIYTISGAAQWFDMSATAADPLNVDFGQTGIGDGAYYPPIGWYFSNLNVLLEPK